MYDRNLAFYQQICRNREARDGRKCNTEARADTPSKIQRTNAQSAGNDNSLPANTAIGSALWYRGIGCKTEAQSPFILPRGLGTACQLSVP
jgi:hypothetical protein